MPSVQRLLGDVRVVGDGYASADPLWQPEYFGGGRPLGFGYVWVCTKDVNAPSAVGSARVESLLGKLVARVATVRPQLSLFEGESPNDWQAHTSFRELRAALDPNASFRPALGFVAVLLLLYVLAVGPLNFRFVQKRGNPTLALLTTPALSFGCLVLMLLVGFIGKGVTMRHRSITWVESLAGADQGLRRTYHGLYSTRPATFDLEAEGRTRFVGTPNVALVHEIGPSGEESLTNIRASLWSTTMIREEEVVGVEPIEFTLEAGELTSVTNRGETALLNAVIVGSGGRVFQIGDIAPGASVSIPAAPTFFVSPGGEDAIARSLGFDDEREDIVSGQLRLVGVLGVNSPTLYAGVERSEGRIGLFAEENSSMLVSVQAPAQELLLEGDASAWRIGTGPLTDASPVSSPSPFPNSGETMRGPEPEAEESP